MLTLLTYLGAGQVTSIPLLYALRIRSPGGGGGDQHGQWLRVLHRARRPGPLAADPNLNPNPNPDPNPNHPGPHPNNPDPNPYPDPNQVRSLQGLKKKLEKFDMVMLET